MDKYEVIFINNSWNNHNISWAMNLILHRRIYLHRRHSTGQGFEQGFYRWPLDTEWWNISPCHPTVNEILKLFCIFRNQPFLFFYLILNLLLSHQCSCCIFYIYHLPMNLDLQNLWYYHGKRGRIIVNFRKKENLVPTNHWQLTMTTYEQWPYES